MSFLREILRKTLPSLILALGGLGILLALGGCFYSLDGSLVGAHRDAQGEDGVAVIDAGASDRGSMLMDLATPEVDHAGAGE